MSLVEYFKTVPGEIFDASDYSLKWIRNILICYLYFLDTITYIIKFYV